MKSSITRWMAGKAQWATRRLIEPIIAPIIQSVSRVNLPERETIITNPVLARGRRFFSQNDEDGILLEILRRIDIDEPSTFLEFGVGDGTECNTIILLAKGWRGAWIGGEPLSFDLPADARLAFSQQWITRENAVSLASKTLDQIRAQIEDVQVASMDIDGNDSHIIRPLLAAGLSPDVFIVEYNAKFPPGVEFEMPYSEHHVFRPGDDFQGVSLQQWVAIFADYRLITCNENGVNAFFVKRSHSGRFADVPTDVDDLYRIGHAYPYQRSGLETSPLTVRHFATKRLE